MRRSLTDSTFLRFYLALLAALVITFGLALFGFLMVDKVRQEHYRESLVSGPLALLADLVSRQPLDRRDDWLASMASTLGMPLGLFRLEDLSLDYFERARLEEKRPVIEAADDGWRSLYKVPQSDWVLAARINSLNEMQLRGITEVLRSWLSGESDKVQAKRLHRVQQQFQVPVGLYAEPPSHVDPIQATRLDAGEVVVRLDSSLSALYIHARVGPDRWLRIGPLPSFEAMPLSLALALLIIVLITLAGAIYLIVWSVEGRVGRLERAATRIAAGHLNARVRVDGNDFLGRLGMALNGMAAQVQSLLRSQQEMIRAVSHELRTPVARIRFAVQMLEDLYGEGHARKQLEGIDEDISELDRLIDEILTYAKLDSENAQGVTLKTESLECRALAWRVLEILSPLHPHLTLTVADGEELEVEAEPRYLQRAVQNLVANACRHAETQVCITIHREPRAIRIDVEDDGPGVPEKDRIAIFKPFARLDDSRTRRSGGYGLGLSIVQKIMVWHGGNVVVDRSERLGGARFSLLLPLHARESISPLNFDGGAH
ncbi:HAMP domain-containing protein [Salinicola endophyticus]|uniref:histidine kinase n=1 Tax=Salinicola endophyticus TaxID=1949083 RepID=A0ABY8FHB7_9GAMM|nr:MULTISPECIES: ATP-binding protein [Salinicola]WFF42209.1 HAMP domain-containing protein [Salinicola endophyticus]